MSTKILFIFEGEKTEKTIANNLTQFFVNENTIVTCAYCTTIYKMYSEILEDEDLDTFNLVKDIETNKESLKNFKGLILLKSIFFSTMMVTPQIQVTKN